MGWPERKYSDEQNAAILYHKNVRNLPAAVVVDLAKRGELEAPSGDVLPPFEIPLNSVYSKAREARASSRRREVSKLVHALPADANEEVRRRLVEITDLGTAKMVDDARRGKPLDPEEARKWARTAREIAAMPAHGLRAPQPGRAASGAGLAGESPAGAKSAAGALMSAARGGAIEPAQSDPILTDVEREQHGDGTTERATEAAKRGVDGGEDDPGSRAQTELERLQHVLSPSA